MNDKDRQSLQRVIDIENALKEDGLAASEIVQLLLLGQPFTNVFSV